MHFPNLHLLDTALFCCASPGAFRNNHKKRKFAEKDHDIRAQASAGSRNESVRAAREENRKQAPEGTVEDTL